MTGDFVEDFEALLEEIDQESEIIDDDTRVRVANTRAAPYRWICNLEFQGRSWATGTLIGPRTVLTAGHNLVDPGGSGKLLKITEMRVIPGRSGLVSEPFKGSIAKDFILFPGFQRGTRTDLGIIHLDDAIGDTVGFWTRELKKNSGDSIGTSILSGSLPVSAGKLKVTISGYALDRPSGHEHGCRDYKKQLAVRCWQSKNVASRSLQCGTFQYQSFDLTVKHSSGLLHYLNDTCPGESGSPVWVTRSSSVGGRVLVAVHIGRDDSEVRHRTNIGVLIDSTVRQFIVDNTK